MKLVTVVAAPEVSCGQQRVEVSGGGGSAMVEEVAPVVLWAGEGEHGVALGEAVLLGQEWGPEVDCGRRRVLKKVAAGGGEERRLRRLRWTKAKEV